MGGNRTLESRAGLGRLGIPQDQQLHLNLSDGELCQDEPVLHDRIVAIAAGNAINTIVSLGETGYDGHPDHVISHRTAEAAVKTLRGQLGQHVVHYALNPEQLGTHRIPATPVARRQKLGAMSCHASQFPIQPYSIKAPDDVTIDGYGVEPAFWESFVYRPLIMHGETYDRLEASSMPY